MIILASSSPRRKYLLSTLDLRTSATSAMSPDVDETQRDEENVENYVQRIAKLKWESIACTNPNDFVISADTTVEGPDGSAMHKPDTESEAEHILTILRGQIVRVLTGVAVGRAAEQDTPVQMLSISSVQFSEFTQEDLGRYVRSGLPIGKAGAFGIQDKQAGPLIQRFSGCYTNIIGLPLCQVWRELALSEKQSHGPLPSRLQESPICKTSGCALSRIATPAPLADI